MAANLSLFIHMYVSIDNNTLMSFNEIIIAKFLN